MKVLRTLWGLLVDDGRLASIVTAALILTSIASLGAHMSVLAGGIIWLGLVVALVVSVEHQLRLKVNALRQKQ